MKEKGGGGRILYLLESHTTRGAFTLELGKSANATSDHCFTYHFFFSFLYHYFGSTIVLDTMSR